MDLEQYATIDQRVQYKIMLGQRDNLSGKNITGAQGFWFVRGQQNVSSPYPDSHLRARIETGQWNFQEYIVSGKAACHGAEFFIDRDHFRIKDVLESGQLGHGFMARQLQDFVRSAFSQYFSALQDQNPFPQGKNFFAAMRYIKNRDSVGTVPLAQIVNDPRLDGGIEGR